MHRLVGSLVTEMGQAFPELGRAQPLVEETLLREEVQFRRTLANGLRLLDEEAGDLGEGDSLPGETAFKLYDTFGFPYDLTEDALRARGISVDRAGFDAAMAQQKAAARAAWKGSGQTADSEVWFDIAEREGASEFTGYTANIGEGVVVALVQDGKEVEVAHAGETVTVLTNQTPFYGESGGQMGDAGMITTNEGLRIVVSDTARPLGRLHAHVGLVETGSVKAGDPVLLAIDEARRDATRANHSATHLLHQALRNRLGAHVTQKGSMVSADRLRFDFAQPTALTVEDIAAIEAEVNAEIRANALVTTRLMTPEDAIAAGAMALFGEKYGEEVRVLSMGTGTDAPYSVELCGGTHVRALGDIGVLRVVSEGAVSSGVRRIEALTGEGARAWLVGREEALKRTAGLLRTTPDDVETRVGALLDERRKLERELTEAKKALALGGGGTKAEIADELIGTIKFAGQVLEGLDPKDLRALLDAAKTRLGSGVAVIVAVNEGKASIAAAVTGDLLGRVSAVDLVRAGVEALGGKGGGGRPDMAQGGGPDGAKAAEAIAAVKAVMAA
jgi:alanyl-tRNA synthetase